MRKNFKIFLRKLQKIIFPKLEMCYNKKIKKQTDSDHSYFIGKRHIMYMKKTDQGEQKRTLYIQTFGDDAADFRG